MLTALSQGPTAPDAEREAKQEQTCSEGRHGGEWSGRKSSSNDSHDETRHHQSCRDARPGGGHRSCDIQPSLWGAIGSGV